MVASAIFSPAVFPVVDEQATSESITSSTATSRNRRSITDSPAGDWCRLRSAPEARLEPSLAADAARGEGENLETRLRDFLAALAADAVPAGVDVGESAIDRLHLPRPRVHDRRHDFVVVGDRVHAGGVLEDLATVIVVLCRARARRDPARQRITLAFEFSSDRSHCLASRRTSACAVSTQNACQ